MAKRRLTERRILGLLVAVIVLYVGSYTVLSWNGGWHWSQTGMMRYDFGFATTDVVRWRPARAYWEPFKDVSGEWTTRANLLGHFYSPLIRLDRHWFHPDQSIQELE